MKVSIIVPCYNEEKNIEMLTLRFAAFAGNVGLELILVDNGSTDSTNEQIKRQCEKYQYIKLVTVPINTGYGNGILQGLRCATGDVLGWIHADLQSDPEVFVKMIQAVKDINSEFLFKGGRKGRSLQDILFTCGMGLYESFYFGTILWDINSQPTLLSRRFYNSMKNPPNDFSLDLYVYVSAKKRKIPVTRFESKQRARFSGKSSWNTKWYSRIKMIKRVLLYSKNVKHILRQEQEGQ